MNLSQKDKHKVNMIIKYKCNASCKELNIFGDKFVKTNQENCSIYVNEKKIDLVSVLKIRSGFIVNDRVTVILNHIEKIKDMSSMFQECALLESIQNISNEVDKYFLWLLRIRIFSGYFRLEY